MFFVFTFSVIFVNGARIRLLWGGKWKSQGCYGVSYILSAFSTSPGTALSPPVFRCHGDDVKLHHRSCPVNSLRGGASNPEKSTEGTIIFRVSNRQITVLPLNIYPYLAVHNARNCAFTGRSVWKPDRSQGMYLIILFLLAILLFFVFLLRLSNLDDAARSRLKRKNQLKIIWPHPSDDDWSDHEKECIKKYICFRLRLGDIIGQNVCKRDWCTDAKCCHAINYYWLMKHIKVKYSGGNVALFFIIFPRICPFCVMQSAGAAGQ